MHKHMNSVYHRPRAHTLFSIFIAYWSRKFFLRLDFSADYLPHTLFWDCGEMFCNRKLMTKCLCTRTHQNKCVFPIFDAIIAAVLLIFTWFYANWPLCCEIQFNWSIGFFLTYLHFGHHDMLVFKSFFNLAKSNYFALIQRLNLTRTKSSTNATNDTEGFQLMRFQNTR